jgi:hypothetical protein
LAGANKENVIYQAVCVKRLLKSANLGRISRKPSMALVKPFWVDLTPIMSVASAKFGYALKEIAGNDITTQLESIAR